MLPLLSLPTVRRLALAVSGLLAVPAAELCAAGFTEPPIIFYGQVNQTYNGYTVPVTQGLLAWNIRSTATGSTPIVVSQNVGSLSGASFYRLPIPIEKLPSSAYKLSANTLSTASATYDRGTVTLDGYALTIVYPVTTDRATFSFAEVSRGKIDHVDLALNTPFVDTDGDGLPDWFEDKYGLNKYDPSDATHLDPFGRTWLNDYNNHVDPAAMQGEYAQWATSNTLQGNAADPSTDVDGDGVPNVLEFALGTNPKVPDRLLSAQRSLVQVEILNGKPYLTLTVQKQGRVSITFVVETSRDLVTWSSVEGTAVQTLTNDASTLKVRSVNSLDAPGGPTYLRLRANLTQQ